MPANTSVITVGGHVVGCIAVREESDAWWVEHFYLHAEAQGRGVGGQVLEHVMAVRGDGRPFRLALDWGSRMRALYERHGFVHVDDDGVDQVFERPTASSGGSSQDAGEGVDRVVVGALVRGNRVLLVHRSPARQWYPGVWDLPGGHVEDGEDPRAALVRELREELGVDAEVVGVPMARTVAENFTVDVWAIRAWSGEPVNLASDQHDDLAWLTLADLEGRALAHRDLPEQVRLAFAAGDRAFGRTRERHDESPVDPRARTRG